MWCVCGLWPNCTYDVINKIFSLCARLVNPFYMPRKCLLSHKSHRTTRSSTAKSNRITIWFRLRTLARSIVPFAFTPYIFWSQLTAQASLWNDNWTERKKQPPIRSSNKSSDIPTILSSWTNPPKQIKNTNDDKSNRNTFTKWLPRFSKYFTRT